MTDLRKCGRCGLRVSAGACDTPPLVFHDRPDHCIEALMKALESPLLRLRAMAGWLDKIVDAAFFGATAPDESIAHITITVTAAEWRAIRALVDDACKP